MSLNVYLKLPGARIARHGSGIFIRANGQTREITREEWDERFPNRKPVRCQQGDETDRKRRFVDTYVATFLASRAAIHYEDCCAADQHDRLTSDQPMEDAVFQALETWALYAADKTLIEPRE